MKEAGGHVMRQTRLAPMFGRLAGGMKYPRMNSTRRRADEKDCLRRGQQPR